MSVIRLHADDSVVIARTTLLPGFELAPGIPALERTHPALRVVRVRTPREAREWVVATWSREDHAAA